MERRLLELCSSGKGKTNLPELKALLSDDSLGNVDASDEHGMTPLMHCAYHGNVEPCNLLISKGAKVNCNLQKDGYTALMFAAVAGCSEVVELLLRAGANPAMMNNLGKTAGNMAAFVGQHECANIIRNYFSLSELDPFTAESSVSGQPLLCPSLVRPLHDMLISIHLHPVKVLLGLEQCPDIVESSSQVTSVLNTLGLQLVNEQKEGLALKLHYLSYCIKLARDHGVDAVLRRLLLFDVSGQPVEMDLMLRQCIREFSHPHLPVLKQVITSLAKTTPGDQPSAYALIISLILGDKEAAAASDACFTCGLTGQLESLKKCSRCKRVWYCSVPCQQLAWTKGNHKKLCKHWTTPTAT